jgi:hypothetical protein
VPAPATPGVPAGFFMRHLSLLIVAGVLVLGAGAFVVYQFQAALEAKRMMTIVNMKAIGLAYLSYHDANRQLASPKMTIKDDAGVLHERELSWRVTLLPYLGSSALQKQFDLSAAWDDPRNVSLQDEMPSSYAHHERPDDTGKLTYFQYFTGPDSLFPDSSPRELKDLKDGLANTMLVADAADSVVWTRPADMAIAPDRPLPVPAKQFFAGMADGTVRVIDRSKTSDAILRQLINPNDGLPPWNWDNGS